MKNYLLSILTILVISCSSGEKKCTISGGIAGRKVNAILLFKASRFPVIEAEIPVTNNSFNYNFKFSQPEVYLLIFKDEFQKGAMRETPFFAEDGKITFTINSDNNMKGYVVKGHKLNDALIDYYRELKEKFYDKAMTYTDSVNAMYRKGTIFTKDFQKVQDELSKTKDESARSQLMDQQRYLKSQGFMYSPNAKKYVQLQDSILKKQKQWETDYIDKNTSLLSLYLFMNRIKEISLTHEWNEVDATSVKRVQDNIDRYSAAFPEHSYILIIKNTLDGLRNIHIGGQINDFTAADIKGDSTSLSGSIKGSKLTLLIFWSTWSAPTVKTCKALLPVYKEFKNKGFEIVGITMEFGAKDEIGSFVKKENYPWKILIDKNNKAGAWEKYNLSYQSGGTFLVNPSGKILAVDLNADEVKAKVAELLK
jgi:peroxiredoxin